MTREQLEILNRVKLLMGYDSKNTLSENCQIILKEQPNNIMDENYQLQAALWLNQNSGDITTKEFKNTWREYIASIRYLNLERLINLSKQLAENGYRPISPGLYGFNKPGGGIANIPIENKIYVLKLNQYNKDKSAYDKNPAGKLIPVKPEPPQYNLVALPTYSRAIILMGEINNTPEQVLTFLEPPKPKSQPQQQTLPNTPFQNQTQSDEFRLWLLSKYPEYEKKPKPFNVDLTSKYTNSTALKQAYKDKGKEYETFLKQRGELYYKPKFITSDATATAVGKGFNPNAGLTSKSLGELGKKEKEQYKQSVLTQFDFSTFPTPIEKYDYEKGKFISNFYKDPIWIEPKTGKKINIQGKTRKQVENELIASFEVQQDKKAEEKLLSDDKLIKIFGKKTIQDEMNNTNCDTESKLEFFKKVLDGKYKDSEGRKIGSYALENGQSIFIKWPSNVSIPCLSVFWRDNGWWIQLGGMVLVSVITPQFGLPRLAATLIELAADTALNIYSLKKNTEAQDEDAMMLDVVFTILPFAILSPPVKAILKRAKFGDNVISSVETKLKSIPKNSSESTVKDVISNMTPEEQRLIREIGKEEHADVLSKVGQDVINNLTKGATASVGRKVAQPLLTVLFYGLPAGGFAMKQYLKIKETLEKNGVSLTESEEKVWQVALTMVQDAEALAANEEKIMKMRNSQNYKNAVAKAEEVKKMNQEYGVDTIEEYQKLEEGVEKIESLLLSIEDEIERALKEYDIKIKEIENQ